MKRRERMTLKEFLVHLERTRKSRWLNGGDIRYYGKELMVDPWADPSHCPITRVCRTVVGSRYNTDRYVAAAEALGLDRRVAHRIARAADGYPNESKLRVRLLQATGLSELLDANG